MDILTLIHELGVFHAQTKSEVVKTFLASNIKELEKEYKEQYLYEKEIDTDLDNLFLLP